MPASAAGADIVAGLWRTRAHPAFLQLDTLGGRGVAGFYRYVVLTDGWPWELESNRRIEAARKLRHLLHMNNAQEMTMLDFDKCWAAVESRDAGADSGFFYGVRTTGVYCRPGCPSRRPLRANTVFLRPSPRPRRPGCGRASAAARPTPRPPLGMSRRSRRRARCCVERDVPPLTGSPMRPRSAAFIFTGCSSRSPVPRRAIMPAPTGSATSPDGSTTASR